MTPEKRNPRPAGNGAGASESVLADASETTTESTKVQRLAAKVLARRFNLPPLRARLVAGLAFGGAA